MTGLRQVRDKKRGQPTTTEAVLQRAVKEPFLNIQTFDTSPANLVPAS